MLTSFYYDFIIIIIIINTICYKRKSKLGYINKITILEKLCAYIMIISIIFLNYYYY